MGKEEKEYRHGVTAVAMVNFRVTHVFDYDQTLNIQVPTGQSGHILKYLWTTGRPIKLGKRVVVDYIVHTIGCLPLQVDYTFSARLQSQCNLPWPMKEVQML